MAHKRSVGSRARALAKTPFPSTIAVACLTALWACSTDVDYPDTFPGSAGSGGASGGPPAAPPAGGTVEKGSDGGAPAQTPPLGMAGTDSPPPMGGAGAPAIPSDGGAGGADPGDPPVALDCEVVRLQAKAIIETNCASCHGPGTNVANFDYVLDTPQLKASGKIKPGEPDASPFFRRISRGEMPPPGAAVKPGPQEVALLYDWIESCTIDPPPGNPTTPACGTPPVDTQAMLRAMLTDISRFDLDDREFIRYFTLNHVRNAGACESDMDVYRFALVKAVNALSQGTQIVAPEAIDQYRTIYRVDLRDYEWDASGARADKWELLAAANPYAFELEEDDAAVLKDFTGTRIPFQAGDWFVNQATQPPLYHDILDIPATRQELERQLGINIVTNIQNGDVWRSGFLDSGISKQNRVIERHELPVSNARTFWVSYDFAGDGGDENIFANPLDFEPDGSEIIFTLPNGLHGYMLASAEGTRLDEAPDVIVVDPTQRDGNVRNGISCMGCHESGMKPKEDEIRAYVLSSSDFDVEEKEAVGELYVPNAVFDSVVNRDSRLFLEAIAALQPPAAIKTEPIIDVFDRFEANVDLKRAAAELGVSPQTLLRELGGLNPALAPLGYATVKRDTFRETFAETVCLLNLGIADDVACGRSRD